jgi:PAS domain S-box-containing protein
VRKKHEEALRESEERYRAFFELTAVGAGQASPEDGRLLRVNEAHCRIAGYTREELLRMSFIEITHPEDREKDVEKFRRLIRGEIAEYSNEKRYLRKDGQSVWVQVHVSLVRDGEGRPLHTVAIVQDISERKRRQEALARSEAFNRRIIESSTDGMTILDPEGNLLYLNPAGQRLMEIQDLASYLNSPWLDFWQGAERQAAHGAMREATSGGEGRFQGYCLTVRGAPRWWDVALAPMKDAEGTVERLLVVSRDITERKRAEALRAGQTQVLEMIATNAPLETILGTLTSFIESQSDGMLCSVLLLDEDGVHMRHGAAPSLPESYTKLIDGVSIGPQAGSCGTAMFRAQPVIVTDILEDPLWDDYRDLAAAHGLRACWSAPILSSQRNVLGSFATYYREPRSPQPIESALIDLAIHIAGIAIERKRAERALRDREERLRLACEAGRMGVWDWDVVANEVVWSKDIFSILGLEPFSIQPTYDTWVERIHPDDLSRVEDTLSTAIREKRNYQSEYRIILPDGTIRWVEGRGQSTHNEAGDWISMKGLMIDITERKQIEQELRESEQRYRNVVETQTELICRNLPDTTLTFVNDAYCRYFKKTREELIGVKFLELIPEPVQPEVLHHIERLIDCPDTETSEHEHEVIRPDGSVGWHHWVNRKILDSAGHVVEVQGIGRDITQRKLAEKALRESEERYRNVVETQTELICRYRCDTTLTFVNDAYCRYFGKTQAQLIGSKFLELIPEEARPDALAHVDSLLANPRIETHEHQVIRADGTIGWQQRVDYAIRDVDGCIVELQAIGRDITDRKQLEEDLQGRNREFSTLVENSPDVISRLDPSLRYLYISPIVERVLGVSPQQFIGKTTREIGAPPHDWDAFETSCRQALETGEIVDREFSYEGRHYHSRLIPEVGAGGSVDSVLCISEDITERRRAERELVQMSVRLLGLQDEERRRLARQLHDVTAQNLFATTINLARLQTLSLAREVKDVLAESQGLCEQGLQEIRTLSYLLHPPLLDQAGLIPALKWYIEGFSKRSGIDVGLVVPQEIDRLTHEVESALFRIVQESLANIHRHSGSNMADVRLEKEGTQVVLQIRDAGHGMPEVTTAEPDIATLGVGIPGMRQRLLQLGGHLNIESSAKGTTVRATVPLPAERRLRSRATGGGPG